MLVRLQGGYANLATISEAELHEDGVILHWGAHCQKYTGADAAAVCRGLEQLAGGTPPATAAPARREPPPVETAPAILPLHIGDGTTPPDPFAVAAAAAEDDDDGEAPAASALSRRVDLVRKFEPIASLSHKHRGAFLSAVEKAADFNHLPPKYRRLIQDAEANRRAELRR